MTGSGTQADPYIIWDVTDLQAINNDVDAWYELGDNIDASATSGWNGGDGFDPIGVAWNDSPFTGHFDGKGHTITGLFIDRDTTDYVGLFAATRDNGGTGLGRIQNVTLANVDITGDDIVGALVGDQYADSGIITNCHSTGTVAGSATGDAIGGLIGIAHGDVTECTSSCTVTGQNEVGGLIGQNSGPTGGGTNTISFCSATGDVTGSGDEVGGFVGETLDSAGDISTCLATGDVTGGDDFVGGFVGNHDIGSIIDCYARGAVDGDDSIGGFAGVCSAPIDNCYSTGAVTGNTNVGGFCGQNVDAITACFWDTDTSGQAASDGGTGKTTLELKDIATITDAGWAIPSIWNITLGCNDSYPCLIKTNACCGLEPLDLVEDKVVLEAFRNIEVVYGGRGYIDREGNFRYESRYRRNV